MQVVLASAANDYEIRFLGARRMLHAQARDLLEEIGNAQGPSDESVAPAANRLRPYEKVVTIAKIGAKPEIGGNGDVGHEEGADLPARLERNRDVGIDTVDPHPSAQGEIGEGSGVDVVPEAPAQGEVSSSCRSPARPGCASVRQTHRRETRSTPR